MPPKVYEWSDQRRITLTRELIYLKISQAKRLMTTEGDLVSLTWGESRMKIHQCRQLTVTSGFCSLKTRAAMAGNQPTETR